LVKPDFVDAVWGPDRKLTCFAAFFDELQQIGKRKFLEVSNDSHGNSLASIKLNIGAFRDPHGHHHSHSLIPCQQPCSDGKAIFAQVLNLAAILLMNDLFGEIKSKR
jgi:hypothetical protein